MTREHNETHKRRGTPEQKKKRNTKRQEERKYESVTSALQN